MSNKVKVSVVLTTLFVKEYDESNKITGLRSYDFASEEEAKLAKANFSLILKEEDILMDISCRINMLQEDYGYDICHSEIHFYYSKDHFYYAISPLLRADNDCKEKVIYYSHYNDDEFKKEILNKDQIMKDLEYLNFYFKIVKEVYNNASLYEKK